MYLIFLKFWMVNFASMVAISISSVSFSWIFYKNLNVESFNHPFKIMLVILIPKTENSLRIHFENKLLNSILDCHGINPHISAMLAKWVSVLLRLKHISLLTAQLCFYSSQYVCTFGHFVKCLKIQSVFGIKLMKMKIVMIMSSYVIWYGFIFPPKSK